MGIHPYGLFGTNESNNPFGSDYELKRQLAARQAQLDALNSRQSLSDDDKKRQGQLNNAVNQLQNRINKAAGANTQAAADSYKKGASYQSSASDAQTNASDDGIIIAKSQSGNTLSAKPESLSVSSLYARPQNSAGQTTASNPGGDYLKGFFLDLKI